MMQTRAALLTLALLGATQGSRLPPFVGGDPSLVGAFTIEFLGQPRPCVYGGRAGPKDLLDAARERLQNPEANLPLPALAGRDLNDAALARFPLAGAELSGANLRKADLFQADLNGAQLARADLRDACLAADLTDANLSGALLDGADFSGCDGNVMVVVPRRLNLMRRPATLLRVRAHAASLRGAFLNDVDARSIVLNGADLTGADLRHGVFASGDLRSAILRNADLRGADFRDALMTDAVLEGALSDAATRWPKGFSPSHRRALQLPPGRERPPRKIRSQQRQPK